ncbi:hypothetical protein FNF28_04616 [Cafeteria roenbergensis]|uniref:Uncharacterized protein n=1 Tax=Cafeteria roenbergensis TaxID=33653 RepID=A0A5A8DBW7_CAFRO|nr:hypothetical protein FNF28_07598 [Cafeteria roenbergensis]KAA0162735.1 hypothetical protein FNF28_04616 [Cafeteria roenbergensis]
MSQQVQRQWYRESVQGMIDALVEDEDEFSRGADSFEVEARDADASDDGPRHWRGGSGGRTSGGSADDDVDEVSHESDIEF